MPTDDDSTLWRLSAFDRLYEDSERAAFLGETRHTMLPTTMVAELGRLLVANGLLDRSRQRLPDRRKSA